MKQIFFALSIFSIFLIACETEVDLNAPYASKTVIYGLLDPIQDTQWVKITKTFIGDGDNLEYAMIRDSSEYDFSEFKRLVVQEIVNNNVVAEFPLQEKEISNKDINGVFYGPLQTVYYFVKGSQLNQNASYKIIAEFYTRPTVTSTTSLVQPSAIAFTNMTAAQGVTIPMASVVGVNSFNYATITRSFTPSESAPFYEVTIRMRLTEKEYTDASHTTLVSSTPKTVSYFAGRYTIDDASSSGRINYVIDGQSFYNLLGNNLRHDPKVVYEIGEYDPTNTPVPGTECFETSIAFGGEELYTFIQINTPSSGIVQERPTYTNVENGLGLWSSRSSKSIADIPLINTLPSIVPNQGNVYALRLGQYTNDINFCDPGNSVPDLIGSCD